MPKAVECLKKDIDEMLTFFDFPEEIRSKGKEPMGLRGYFAR